MNANLAKRLIIGTAALLLVGPLVGGCARTSSSGDSSTSVHSSTDDDGVLECDAEDRRKNETPDCGFKLNGTFVPWSWVKAGKTTAPAGWNRAAEEKNAKAAVKRPATTTRTPAATRPARTAKATKRS